VTGFCHRRWRTPAPPCPARCQPLFLLRPPMCAQHVDRDRCQGDSAVSVARFGWLNRNALLGLLDRALDLHSAVVKVDLVPAQSQQFATTRARTQRPSCMPFAPRFGAPRRASAPARFSGRAIGGLSNHRLAAMRSSFAQAALIFAAERRLSFLATDWSDSFR
jgi:hypothetical protein